MVEACLEAIDTARAGPTLGGDRREGALKRAAMLDKPRPKPVGSAGTASRSP